MKPPAKKPDIKFLREIWRMEVPIMPALLEKHELEKASKGLKSWKSSEEELLVTYTFKSFRDAITFITRISFEVDEMDHHPEITSLYNKVSIRLTTHDAGDKVTEKDIILAGRIQENADLFLDGKISGKTPS